jgi:aspartate aminotransferase
MPGEKDRDVASAQIRRAMGTIEKFAAWATSPEMEEALGRPSVCDFVFGNPHEVAPAAYVEALTRAVQPTGPSHYAYKLNESGATAAIAAGLRERFGLGFGPEDVFMTNGNFAGLSILLQALVDPGDEVIFISPPWFFYETLIVAAGATPVRVYANRDTFDLDLDAVASAISPRTRAIIVNSPNNPSGRIYPRETLDELGRLLTEASDRHGHPIWLLSDEAYNRIVFDDRTFPTPVASYARSFLVYTYGKTHLAPGSRVGYIALAPDMPEREELRAPLLVSQIATGWAFPVAPLQVAIPELESVVVDLKALQRRRDRLVSELRDQGYQLIEPEGTFYILVRSPLADDEAFCLALADRDVYVLPGAMFEMPGWFRISVTANDDMVERALPGFAAAIAEAP